MGAGCEVGVAGVGLGGWEVGVTGVGLGKDDGVGGLGGVARCCEYAGDERGVVEAADQLTRGGGTVVSDRSLGPAVLGGLALEGGGRDLLRDLWLLLVLDLDRRRDESGVLLLERLGERR